MPEEIQSPDSPGSPGFREEFAIFFPDPAMPCRYNPYLKKGAVCHRGSTCEFSHENTSLVKLLLELRHAKRSLDICVFTISCDEISHEVMAAHQRGVNVRIITDDRTQGDKGSDIQWLREGGIPVKDDHDASHMHHKFCVIDGKYLLNGSFNWTRSAVNANHENVVISRNKGISEEFLREFNKLWDEF